MSIFINNEDIIINSTTLSVAHSALVGDTNQFSQLPHGPAFVPVINQALCFLPFALYLGCPWSASHERISVFNRDGSSDPSNEGREGKAHNGTKPTQHTQRQLVSPNVILGFLLAYLQCFVVLKGHLLLHSESYLQESLFLAYSYGRLREWNHGRKQYKHSHPQKNRSYRTPSVSPPLVLKLHLWPKPSFKMQKQTPLPTLPLRVVIWGETNHEQIKGGS